MHGLDPDLKQLLDQARGSDDPTAADRARVTRALAARLGAGVLAAAATSATTTAAGATTATGSAAGGVAVPAAGMAGLGAGAKLVGVVALLGTVGLGATVAVRSHRVPEPRSPVVMATNVEAWSAAPLPPAARQPAALEDEVRLLRDAQQAMRDGRPDRALALADEHGRRFPNGLLRQERLAVRVLALCGLGRAGPARREAERFLREWPASPFSSQIRASCRPPLR